MTKIENRQRIKNEALNKIRKIFNPRVHLRWEPYDERSFGEQREETIRYIIEAMEKELDSLK